MRALIVSLLLMSLGLGDGLSHAAKADMARLLRDGPLARDYVNNLEWMRCSVGQVWESDTCAGEILMLSVPEAHEVVARIKSLEGGGWRLPTARELQSLVSKVENRPNDFDANIDLETFPNTFAGPYWSSDQSFYTTRYQWSVNFFTGQSYNRFFPTQKIAVRLVRSFKINSNSN